MSRTTIKVFYVLAAMVMLFLCALLSGCKGYAYKTVATDVNRSQEHKDILNQVCAQTFPPLPPIYKEGKTVIKTDTVTKIDTVTNVENSEVIKYVYKTNTVTVDRFKMDTVVITNQYVQTALNDKIRVCEKEKDGLQYILSGKDSTIKKWQKYCAIAGGLVVMFVIASILKLYFKLF